MNNKSLLKSISALTASISLALSIATPSAADVSTSKVISGESEKQNDSQLWGQLSNNAGTCHSAYHPSRVDANQVNTVASLEKAYKYDTAKIDSKSANTQLLVCSQK